MRGRRGGTNLHLKSNVQHFVATTFVPATFEGRCTTGRISNMHVACLKFMHIVA